jgi:ADP-heptose:LPS heptosyltransferase
MKTIVISPWARPLRNGKENAKNYGAWIQLVELLKSTGFYIVQIGTSGEKPINAHEQKLNLSPAELEKLIKDSYKVITIDSYIQHLCWSIEKPCICLWGKSDPLIFGHPENTNLLKDRRNLRPDPWRWWEDIPYDPSVFVSPEVVLKEIIN